MRIDESIFKAYDIRGIVPDEITPDIAYLVGKAYARAIRPEPRKVALARDVRTSGQGLLAALAAGLRSEGIDVVSIGAVTTEMLYHAVASRHHFGGGIIVSASHNPREFNGFKLVRDDAKPVSIENGIAEVRDEAKRLAEGHVPGSFAAVDVPEEDVLEDYLDKVASLSDIEAIRSGGPRKIALNGNHGMAGRNVARLIEKFSLPLEQVWLYKEVDGSFPQGRPDPLYPDNQEAMRKAVAGNGCELGVAWDADADRCFFFDEGGTFVNGYYAAAFLAGVMQEKRPGSTAVHDPRLVWAIEDAVKRHGGASVRSKSGHSFMKERLRESGAVFGAEISGHYYFKDFWSCDSGLVPFLLLLEALAKKGGKLSEHIAPIARAYPISGELNFPVLDAANAFKRIEEAYGEPIDRLDGLTIEREGWRANVRTSNTEPLMRLNIEARSPELVSSKVAELSELMK